MGNKAELAEIYERLRRADRPVIEEGDTVCCYARSEKELDRRPAGRPMGDLPDHRRKHRIRHGPDSTRAGEAEDRSGLLFPDLLRTKRRLRDLLERSTPSYRAGPCPGPSASGGRGIADR